MHTLSKCACTVLIPEAFLYLSTGSSKPQHTAQSSFQALSLWEELASPPQAQHGSVPWVNTGCPLEWEASQPLHGSGAGEGTSTGMMPTCTLSLFSSLPEKAAVKSYFSEVPVTSSGQLLYSRTSNGVNPVTSPISFREATGPGSD